MALGGTSIGVGVTWAVAKAKSWLSQHFGENTGALILISLLIPFGAYLLAEHLHCSGILAAVAAGITMSYAELWGHVRGETRMQRAAVWNTVQFAANGAVFVLLGEQMPRILSRAAAVVWEAGHHQAWMLAVYVLAITAALAALRFVGFGSPSGSRSCGLRGGVKHARSQASGWPRLCRLPACGVRSPSPVS